MTTMTRRSFGSTPAGEAVEAFTLQNASGSEITVITFGGAITSIRVPGREGVLGDVVLGYDTLEGYLADTCHFGASIGRFGNRIGKGRFTLNGKTYQLECNDGNNHLHGGSHGFDRRVWRAEPARDATGDCLKLHLHSADGDAGYPGNLDVTVTYSFSDKNELILHYQAKSDADTIVNLTNHSYFNLAGHDSGDILNQQVKILAGRFTPADRESIPYGTYEEVDKTPMDFRGFHRVGERIGNTFDQLAFAGGYDHNWVLDKGHGVLGEFAQVYDEGTGRMMTVETTLPCVQFYTANYVKDVHGKGGAVYQKRGALCLETQFAPDSPNKPEFESPVLRAGKEFDETTLYRFETI